MLSTVAISWSVLKMGRGILGLFGEQFMYSIAELERGSAKEFFLCLAYSLVYVFCDAIPVLLTLNGTVVQIFIQSDSNIQEEQISLIDPEVQ